MENWTSTALYFEKKHYFIFAGSKLTAFYNKKKRDLSFLERHVLGFAVGHHTNDANHQQGHTDACDSQHPPLVELLCLCG